ncbi:MAG: DUF6305 family protein [Spirochaetia bacterium]|jgi:hypothetical protein|uniref:DUF6305 domain-containing protein n=1 Tax=bioreactor metagenome TaxID=1076179 RepID=A0A644WKW8_9ZZZZ|nr:DUF6305 family protein [Spirochaetia bacterium]MCE1208997.1 DUF6305 family protein [Spirochaetia bacterium]VBB40705.1 conserved exported hypothetical protein [uncultured Spirochaetota bacterium]HOI23883.1 DUF6305 family protein [Spirochaetales bacterium]
MSRGKYFRHSPFTCAVLLVLFCVVPALAAQEEDTGGSFRAYLPVAITSGGQSPDSFVVSASARQVGIAHRYDDLITAQGLAGFRSLIIVMGASSKGLGEAGLSVSKEIARVSALVERAKSGGMKIIAVHIGGNARRGALSDDFITLVVPHADCIVATNEGNGDGLFTKEARKSGIPLFLLKSSREINALLREIFLQG